MSSHILRWPTSSEIERCVLLLSEDTGAAIEFINALSEPADAPHLRYEHVTYALSMWTDMRTYKGFLSVETAQGLTYFMQSTALLGTDQGRELQDVVGMEELAGRCHVLSPTTAVFLMQVFAKIDLHAVAASYQSPSGLYWEQFIGYLTTWRDALAYAVDNDRYLMVYLND